MLLVRYLRGDEELGFEQFTLTAPTPLCTVPGVPAPRAQVSENKLWVYFDRGHLVFNGTTGQIEDYVVDGVPLLHPDPEGEIGPAVALYRAPLDNDMNLRRNWEQLGLDRAGFYIKKPGTVAKMYMVTDNGVEITADYVLAGPRVPWLGSFRLTYTVYRTGKVRLDVLCLRPNRRRGTCLVTVWCWKCRLPLIRCDITAWDRIPICRIIICIAIPVFLRQQWRRCMRTISNPRRAAPERIPAGRR